MEAFRTAFCMERRHERAVLNDVSTPIVPNMNKIHIPRLYLFCSHIPRNKKARVGKATEKPNCPTHSKRLSRFMFPPSAQTVDATKLITVY